MKMFESNQSSTKCQSQLQDYVIKCVTKVLEIWGQGFDGTFTIKCENGNARLNLSVDLGSQEATRDGISVSGPTRVFFDNPRKSRSSPSKKRRSRARAEAYQLKKSLFQTKNENCGIDTRSTEEVFVSEAVTVADLNKVETDEDVKDDDNTDDDASNDDDSSNDVDSSADEDSSDDDDSSADDDDASNDDEGSDLAFIVMCENYVTELARGHIYLSPQGYFKEDYETIEAWRREVVPWRGKDRQLTDIQNKLYVFKVNFGFHEGGGYNGDLSWIDFYDLHLYSKKCRTPKCEELMVIIEI